MAKFIFNGTFKMSFNMISSHTMKDGTFHRCPAKDYTLEECGNHIVLLTGVNEYYIKTVMDHFYHKLSYKTLYSCEHTELKTEDYLRELDVNKLINGDPLNYDIEENDPYPVFIKHKVDSGLDLIDIENLAYKINHSTNVQFIFSTLSPVFVEKLIKFLKDTEKLTLYNVKPLQPSFDGPLFKLDRYDGLRVKNIVSANITEKELFKAEFYAKRAVLHIDPENEAFKIPKKVPGIKLKPTKKAG